MVGQYPRPTQGGVRPAVAVDAYPRPQLGLERFSFGKIGPRGGPRFGTADPETLGMVEAPSSNGSWPTLGDRGQYTGVYESIFGRH
jgi:hypothetical protein